MVSFSKSETKLSFFKSTLEPNFRLQQLYHTTVEILKDNKLIEEAQMSAVNINRIECCRYSDLKEGLSLRFRCIWICLEDFRSHMA